MRATPGGVCSCATRAAAAAGGCRGCALRFLADRLRDAGYNSAVCRSKWSRTPEIPSGKTSRSENFLCTVAERTQKMSGVQIVKPNVHVANFLARSYSCCALIFQLYRLQVEWSICSFLSGYKKKEKKVVRDV
jgi:hypothetical protein